MANQLYLILVHRRQDMIEMLSTYRTVIVNKIFQTAIFKVFQKLSVHQI